MKFKLQFSIFLLTTLVLISSGIYFAYHYQVGQAFYSRQDKVNNLYRNQDFWCKSDGIILGSSRTFPIGNIELNNLKFYNFSTHGMYPREYSAYIQYYKDTCKKDPSHILLGLDFFTSNTHAGNWAEKPEFFINRRNKPFQYLLTKRHILPRWQLYQKEYGTWGYPTDYRPLKDKLDGPLPKNESLSLESVPVVYQHNLYINRLYGRYDYNTELLETYKAIVNNNPNSTINTWITPVSSWMFSALFKFALVDEYQRFVTDVIDAFGSVHNLMYVNPISALQENFLDIAHIRVDILDFMLKDIFDICHQCDVLGDYSINLDANNISGFFQRFDQYAKEHSPEGKQVTVSKYLNTDYSAIIKQGEVLDLLLAGDSTESHKRMSLCIETRGDFSLIKINAEGTVSSKIYQPREDCRFVIDELGGAVKIRLVPLFKYPLKLSTADYNEGK